MPLPPITAKQQELILLIFKYRFLNRIQIQSLLRHKDKRRINSWLKDLIEKGYLSRIYSHSFVMITKPALYYMSLNGIKYIRSLGYTEGRLRKLYKEDSRQERFIAKHILIADCCLTLLSKNSKATNYLFQTESECIDLVSDFHFLTDLGSNLVFTKQQGKKETNYLLTLFDLNLPRYRIRKKLKDYIDFFFKGTWKENTDRPFPIFLLVFPTKALMIYAKRLSKKLLEENQNPDDLHLRFTTEEEVQKEGVTSEIWEEV